MAIFVNVRKTGDFYRFHKFCLDGVGVYDRFSVDDWKNKSGWAVKNT